MAAHWVLTAEILSFSRKLRLSDGVSRVRTLDSAADILQFTPEDLDVERRYRILFQGASMIVPKV